MQFPDTARTCQEGNFLAEYVQIKVKTIIKRLNDVKRQTNYLVCNIEGTGTCFMGDRLFLVKQVPVPIFALDFASFMVKTSDKLK